MADEEARQAIEAVFRIEQARLREAKTAFETAAALTRNAVEISCLLSRAQACTV